MNSQANLTLCAALLAVCGSTVCAQTCMWTLIPHGAKTPVPRFAPALAYDAARSRVVLFGGGAGGPTTLQDTWEWDGAAWSLRATSGPPNRIYAGTSFDSARGRLILFGGRAANSSSWLNDTWEWNGTSWHIVATTGPLLQYPQLVFDAARAKTVMFAYSTTGSTYEWDGTSWVERTIPGPGPRGGSALAYDSARARILLYGGWSASGINSEVWEYDGLAWTQRPPVGLVPRGRTDAAVAYDISRQRLVMTGGNFQVPPYSPDGTWEYAPASGIWTQRSTVQPGWIPDGRMVYDSIRSRCILPGGYYFGLWGSMWEFTGDGSTEFLIAQQPVTQTVNLYDPATISVNAPGATGYQWFRDRQAVVDGGPISGATTATLSISRCGLSAAAGYSVLVYGPCGPAGSDTAYLNVNPVGCYINCDGSTSTPVLSAEDFQCYLNEYASGSSRANCDGSTGTPLLTANDFQCFLNGYAQGCN